jgi:hypothetical protein
MAANTSLSLSPIIVPIATSEGTMNYDPLGSFGFNIARRHYYYCVASRPMLKAKIHGKNLVEGMLLASSRDMAHGCAVCDSVVGLGRLRPNRPASIW